MEENFIYDDLATQGDLGEMINDLQTRNNELQQHVSSLEQDIAKLCDKITEMKTVQDNLSKNISELFNTAKNELERKDRRIAELQDQLDDIVFRRRRSNSGFKRKWEESCSDEISKRPRTKSANLSHSGETNEILVVSDEEESCRDLKGPTCKNISGKLNIESDIPVSRQQESDLSKLTHSKENTYSREKRDYHRDTYRKDYRSWNANRSKTEDREIKKDFRDDYRDNRDHDRRYRDKSRGRSKDLRNDIQEYRTNPRDYRDYRRNNRDSHSENKQRQSNEHNSCESNRIEKYDNSKYASNHQMDRHSRNEPVISSGGATHRNVSVAEDISVEEGEIFDENPTKGTKINEENILNKNLDAVRNLSFKDRRSHISHKFPVEQERRTTVKNPVSSHGRDDNNQEDKLKDLKNKNMIKDRQNLEKNGKVKTAAEKAVIEINNPEDMKEKQEKLLDTVIGHEDKKISTKKDMTSNNEKNVNIISQIILNEGAKDISKDCASKSEVENKTQHNIQDKKENPPIILKTDRRKRESRVPRNLTDELNINLERSKKTQDLMYELFGSSEKKKKNRMLDEVSPKSLYSLSDDGEIPELKLFSKSDFEEQKLNPHSVKIDSNPVTEFQIFKTNLPCLEKSNSLSSISVQIQTPDFAPTNKESVENSQPKNEKSSLIEGNKVSNREKCEKVKIHQASSGEGEKKDDFGQSTNDICSIIDLDIRQFQAKDFPNLNAVLESKDASDSLLISVQENSKIDLQKCITQDSKEKKDAITNIDGNEPVRKKYEMSSHTSDHIEKPSKTGNEKGNEQKNDTSKTTLKQWQFSSHKEVSGQSKSNVCEDMPTKDNKPQSVPHSNHPQQKYISDLLTPCEGTEHMVPRQSIHTNGIPRNNTNNTKKSQDPKKTSKTNNRKSVSPSEIQKQCHSTKIKDEKEIPHHGDEKFKHSLVDRMNKPLKPKRTEKNLKESIAQVPIEEKNSSKSTDPVTNTGIPKSTNSSKSVAKSDSKDMSDLLSVEDNIKTIPKKCTTSSKTGKTGNCKNKDKKHMDSCVSTSSKKPLKASDKKAIDAEIKLSKSSEAPVNMEVEDITHQKVSNQLVSELDQVSTVTVKETQSHKEATRTQVHKNCKTEKDVTNLIVTDVGTTVSNISQKSADPNVIEKVASLNENVNIATTNTTANSLPLTTEKTSENINLNKRPINQNVILQTTPDEEAKSKATSNSDRKRRRCAIKLV